eukprot:Hpha_TRINITY_DN28981_c0_g1::TRINITY_DN28981_c0_g1_i1::g.19473::m.19473
MKRSKEVGEVWSDWQRRQVRVHYVGQRPEAYDRIEDAINAASPYDRVEVSGGRYLEKTVVNKVIELVAADGETPELTYRGTVLMFSGAATAYVTGLEVVQSDKSRETQTVVVGEGNPIIMNCTMTSVVVSGSAAPHLENNTIA